MSAEDHMAHCAIRTTEICTCGAVSDRTEAEARAMRATKREPGAETNAALVHRAAIGMRHCAAIFRSQKPCSRDCGAIHLSTEFRDYLAELLKDTGGMLDDFAIILEQVSELKPGGAR